MSMSQNMINFVLSLITSGILVGMAYGAISARINALEDCAIVGKADHESVLVIGTKLDTIIEDIRELKQDIKDIKSRIVK